MTSDDLESVLASGEGQRIEFKEDATKPADLAQTLVAFANAQGGVVLLGVRDNAEPVGVHAYKQTYDMIVTAASYELCDPPSHSARLNLWP